VEAVLRLLPNLFNPSVKVTELLVAGIEELLEVGTLRKSLV
jgi:hypothetical protein